MVNPRILVASPLVPHLTDLTTLTSNAASSPLPCPHLSLPSYHLPRSFSDPTPTNLVLVQQRCNPSEHRFGLALIVEQGTSDRISSNRNGSRHGILFEAGMESCSLVLPLCLAFNGIRSDELTLSSFPSVPELQAEAPPSSSEKYLDPTTKTPFPRQLESPSGTLKLMGTGVRVVSFFAVQVYTVGFYVDEKVLKEIKEGKIQGWEVS